MRLATLEFSVYFYQNSSLASNVVSWLVSNKMPES